MQHMRDAPPSLRELNPNVSPELEAVVLHAMSKKMGDRPSAAELAKRFGQALGRRASDAPRAKSAAPPSPPPGARSEAPSPRPLAPLDGAEPRELTIPPLEQSAMKETPASRKNLRPWQSLNPSPSLPPRHPVLRDPALRPPRMPDPTRVKEAYSACSTNSSTLTTSLFLAQRLSRVLAAGFWTSTTPCRRVAARCDEPRRRPLGAMGFEVARPRSLSLGQPDFETTEPGRARTSSTTRGISPTIPKVGISSWSTVRHGLGADAYAIPPRSARRFASDGVGARSQTGYVVVTPVDGYVPAVAALVHHRSGDTEMSESLVSESGGLRHRFGVNRRPPSSATVRSTQWST